MDSGQNIYNPTITKLLDPKEESLFYRDYDFFDMVLSINDMISFKNQVIWIV